jgi:hypothetical protein
LVRRTTTGDSSLGRLDCTNLSVLNVFIVDPLQFDKNWVYSKADFLAKNLLFLKPLYLL